MKIHYKKTLCLLLFIAFASSQVFAAKASAPIVENSSTLADNDVDESEQPESISVKHQVNTKEVTTKDTSSQNSFMSNMLLQSIGLIGISYKWGGNTPTSGMDCSGFIKYVFKQSLGIDLPRTASEMSRVGKKITINELQPGDLIFFNTGRGSNTHIGMYIGDNKFIQAQKTGTKIQISDFDGYWRSHFNGGKRIVQETVDNDGNDVIEDYSDIHNEALPSNYRPRKIIVGRHHHSSSKHKGTAATANVTANSTKTKATANVTTNSTKTKATAATTTNVNANRAKTKAAAATIKGKTVTAPSKAKPTPKKKVVSTNG